MTKYYNISYSELQSMPYAIFLGYLKYARVFEMEKTEEGRAILEFSKAKKETEPDMDKLRGLSI